MIQIDQTKCVGCGLCVYDCFPGALEIAQGRPVLASPAACIGCGHCIAICPQAAVTDDRWTEVYPLRGEMDSQALLGLMRSRRSCRHYKEEPVPEAMVETLIEAARACPTAKNLQATRYIVVTERIPALLDAALSTLGELGAKQLKTATEPDELRRAENFIRWAERRRTDGDFDPLFFHAPLLLMLVNGTDTPRDTAAGAAWAELMAASLGLGCLYSGYFTACAAVSPEIRRLLELDEAERVERCLVLGWPDVRFQRTAPRKPPDVRHM